MYKYAKDSSIIEGIFKMISILQYYEIEPIFIFDDVRTGVNFSFGICP